MLDKIQTLRDQITKTKKVDTKEALEQFRMKYIGRNNVINELFKTLKGLSSDEKRTIGPKLNELKEFAFSQLQLLSLNLANKSSTSGDIDVTLPPLPNSNGSIHPISHILSKVIHIFETIGFDVHEGPEIEDDYHNFTALNFPPHHPARQMQDTYFIERDPDILLRTHTSNVQIRLMNRQPPPIRAIMPGRVYRNEAISARAHCFFHQVEGLFVDKNVSFKDMKTTLYYFSKEMFGNDIQVRLRPSYFPFTEPSAELDISCLLCKGKGCRVCKNSGWVEIAGAGMVDPNVLTHCKLDPLTYSGYAFGMGIERVTMLKYQLDDIRLFSENNIEFLRQF